MSKQESTKDTIVYQLHSDYPAVGKSIIQNELRKHKGDYDSAKKSIESINQSIIDADNILDEDPKFYKLNIDDSDDSEESSGEEEKSDVSMESPDEVEEKPSSEDEKEISQIWNEVKHINYMEDIKTLEASKKLTSSETDDLVAEFSEKFKILSPVCIKEAIKYFYPNLDKIDQVLTDFQAHWYAYYFQDYKVPKKERKNKAKKHEEDIEINPELVSEIECIESQIQSAKFSDPPIENTEFKSLKQRLKGLKKLLRVERKQSKLKEKARKKDEKLEKKRLKMEEKLKRKQERKEKRDQEKTKKGEKSYEDDVFFREIRQNLIVIKDELKQTKKMHKKALRKGTEEEKAELACKLKLLEERYLEEQENVIWKNYDRYNKPEERKVRLDLHGLRKGEAVRLVDIILKERAENIHQYSEDEKQLSIVTGKGGHSGRPILKMAVKDYLLDRKIPYTELHNGAGYMIC
jgi:hypothetical protein